MGWEIAAKMFLISSIQFKENFQAIRKRIVLTASIDEEELHAESNEDPSCI